MPSFDRGDSVDIDRNDCLVEVVICLDVRTKLLARMPTFLLIGT